MYKGKEYNIFICYRGSISGQGGLAGSILYRELNEITGFEPFYANAVLDEGADNFKNASRQVLRETKVFILLLTPGFFDGCSYHDDMVKDEIQTALRDARIRFIPITLPEFDAKREFTKEVRGIFEGDFEERIEHISQIAWNDPGRFEIKDKLIRTISRILDDYGKDNAAAQAVSDDRPSAKSIGAKDARLTIENGALVKCAEDAKGELIIPDGVTSIATGAFYDCTSLTSVTIPDSVTSIGSSAFQGCTSLASVTIGKGVTSIDWVAFSGCTSLKAVYITDIGKWAAMGYMFESDNPLHNGAALYLNGKLVTELVLPDCVTSIGGGAFFGCTSLTSVTIGNGVESIGNYAFSRCNSLASVTIPDSVMNIGRYTFSGCGSLQYNEYGAALYLGNNENPYLVLIKAKEKSITSANINASTKLICDRAFEGCANLTSVAIPDSVTGIGEEAFESCAEIIEVVDHVNYLDNWAIAYDSSYDASVFDLFLRERTRGIGDNAFSGCNYLTSVIMPDSVVSIGKSAFSGCDALTSVTIGSGVTSIGDSAFSGCTFLESVTIPGSVKSIGRKAFCGCDSLTSVTIPNSVTSIGQFAFESCYSLEAVIIPDSVTSIGEHAFAYCDSLTSVTFDGTKAEWNAVDKGSSWKHNCPFTEVKCSDGVVAV